ncbi:restriction endonuclease subunit S [Edwardsiella tarda]|uniref:restriction endonuclease subunit S n=1 Tax=Edwardsiella tarda TaxID=636 RepID=UPI00266EFA39|nr:restriction endonuclease subunit S [Edwardsiella tarda]WKS81606.1 restriction endonuclease subunit S [Edwardsiella tarda]
MAGLNKYRAYSEYNSTNIEGLVQLPSHWELKQVRYLLKDGAEGTKIGPFGSSLKLEDMVDDGVQVYGQENVIKRDFSLGKRRISFNKFKEMGVYEVFFGDILITMMGTSGKCEIVPQTAEKGIIDSHLIRVRVNNKLIIPGFFKLLVDESPEIKHQIKIQGKGSIMLGLNSGIIRSLYLPLPSISEQKLILGFLDYETKKIDNLIEKQQKLIELLKEKRQAVISHAVTKGLNPDVPMKDSGVEWLGDVPEHWKLIKFSHCVSIRSGQVDPRKFPYCDYWLIAPNHIVSGEGRIINLETAKDQGADSGKYLCRTGEVIYSKIRPALVKTCLSPSDTVLCSADMYPMTSYNGLTNNFLLLYLLSDVFTRFAVNQADRVAMPKINRESLSDCKIPVPPIDEQEKIYSHAREALEKLDVLLQKSQLTIEFFQERRAALISAAVTGKIDVRDWVAPGTQESEEPQEVSA